MPIAPSFFVFFLVTCLVTCEAARLIAARTDSCEVNRVENGDVLREDLIPIRNTSGYQIGTKAIYLQAITSSSVSSGTSLHIRCNDPYRFQGDRASTFVEIRCTDGRWNPFPVCLLPPCDKRSLIYLGLDKGGERIFFHGESFEPRCLHGYRVSETADKRIICENGQWTGNLPPCTKEGQCKLPQNPEFGSVELVGNIATVGSVVIFKCDAGRKLVGSVVSKCNNIGEWTSPTPKCVGGCKTESLLDFEGLIVENRRTLDDGEWFEPRCDEGFKLADEDDPKIYCRDGRWEGTLPPCSSSEKTPCSTETLSHYEGLAVENFRMLKDGDSFPVKCEEGFETSDKEDPTISCRDGKWEGNLPPCNPAPCRTDFLTIFDGLLLDDDILFNDGQFLPIKCSPGYEVPGNSGPNNTEILCSKGQWIVNLPPCVPISEDCQLPSVSNGDLGRYEDFQLGLRWKSAFKPVSQGEALSEEGSLILRCNDGYVPPGEKSRETTIFCLDGTLSPDPKCVRAAKREPCTTESLLGFSGVVLSKTGTVADGAWIEPKCAEGYEYLNRNATKLYCRGGQWEGTLPPCFPAPCLDNPPIPENGRVKPTWWNIEHGSVVEYECIRNSEMTKESTVTCSFGKWTGSLPTCKDRRCYRRNLPRKEGVDLSNDVSVQSFKKADIVCMEGYSLKYPEVRCIHGEWQTQNNLSPCQPSQCEVTSVENGEILKQMELPVQNVLGVPTATETVYVEANVGSFERSGSTLYLSCRDPYKFYGAKGDEEINDITCRGGRWVPSPRCELPTTCSMATLYQLLPSDIIIYTDDSTDSEVPRDSILKLACRQLGMVFKGNSNAVCTADGTWSVGPNIQCTHGCERVQRSADSDLIVYPDKRFYNFGESIEVSCPEEMSLTNDVERILCLRYGWEPNTIPDCE